MTALFRLAKDALHGWRITCNVCDHSVVHRHGRDDAVRRLDALLLRSRLITPPPCRECADLAAQVDALATERDDLRMVAEMLTAKVAHAEQANSDLRRNFRAAYEPVQVGGCRKVRHTSREASDQHAIEVATRSPGDVLNSYPCRVCPTYPVTGERPWHVGHARPGDDGALWVERGVLHYWCGCKFSIVTRDQVWACPSHTAVAS